MLKYNCLLFGAGQIRSLQRQHCGCFINFIMPARKVAKLTTRECGCQKGDVARGVMAIKLPLLRPLKTGLNCRPRPFYEAHKRRKRRKHIQNCFNVCRPTYSACGCAWEQREKYLLTNI